MIIETVEGYTPKGCLNDMFHIEEDPLGGEQWVLDAPVYEAQDERATVKIRITIELID